MVSAESTEMKAAVYWYPSEGNTENGQNNVKLTTRPKPKGGRRNHILVRVHAVGLNPVDAKNVLGDKFPHSWSRLHLWWQQKVLHNRCIGFDFSGVVEEDFEGFTKGDKVFGDMPPLQGSLAEYVSVPKHQVSLMPKTQRLGDADDPASDPFVQAAALPLVGLTVLQCLEPCLSSGDSLLVVGASGGTGHVGLSVAKAMGAQCTAICSRRNIEFCKEAGADTVLAYDDYTDQSELLQALKDCSGCPFDMILDCVTSEDPGDSIQGYPQVLQDKANAIVVTSKPHIYRRLGGPPPDWIRAGMARTLAIFPAAWFWPDRHERLFWIRFPNSSQELQQIADWVDEGKLAAHVSKVYKMTAPDIQLAFQDLLGRRVRGKVVIRIVET